jgi:hypothetical protein
MNCHARVKQRAGKNKKNKQRPIAHGLLVRSATREEHADPEKGKPISCTPRKWEGWASQFGKFLLVKINSRDDGCLLAPRWKVLVIKPNEADEFSGVGR